MRRLGVTRPTVYNFLLSVELRPSDWVLVGCVSGALADFIRSRELAEAG
jgi:hypothetical protein